MVFLDNSDQAGALAYHDLTDEGWPISKVFVKTIVGDNASVRDRASTREAGAPEFRQRRHRRFVERRGGKVIGREGRTAGAIRTILNAAGMKLNRRYKLEILE